MASAVARMRLSYSDANLHSFFDALLPLLVVNFDSVYPGLQDTSRTIIAWAPSFFF